MPPALESVRLYRETLRAYTSDELEDIYFHIDVLREPLRYRLVQMEMDRRGLCPEQDDPGARSPREWIERTPGFGRWPVVRSVYLCSLLFMMTVAIMAAMLVPIWLFAVPLKFTGVQASLVYLILLPVTAPVGLVFGIKAGGWKMRSVVVPAAVLLSLWAFYAVGGVDAILKPLFQAGGVAGNLFGGF